MHARFDPRPVQDYRLRKELPPVASGLLDLIGSADYCRSFCRVMSSNGPFHGLAPRGCFAVARKSQVLPNQVEPKASPSEPLDLWRGLPPRYWLCWWVPADCIKERAWF